MIMHFYHGTHFQMYALIGNCIVIYLVIRICVSTVFSHLIILGRLAVMARFIAYLCFSTYLLCSFVLKSCYLFMILVDYLHPLLNLIRGEAIVDLVFAFDSLCIPGSVGLDYLFLEDGLDIHLPGFSFLRYNFCYVLLCLQRCFRFYLLVIVRLLIFALNMEIEPINCTKVLHVQYIDHSKLRFDLNNNR